MQSQPDRRSNSPYHHMMNVPQVQQAPLPPPHPPMHDPNARPPAPGVPPYDFPSEYPPPGPGPSDFHHAPPMYRAEVNPVGAPPPAQMQSQPPTHNSRPLNNSKRAEQNRKAQRAFRERRDQHVKQLESRSAMLDVALANADEANRRLEDSRILVEQLRAENQALRTALSAYVPQHGHPHSQLMIQTVPIPGLLHQPPGQPIPQGEAAPGQQAPATQAPPPVPVLDPSLPSQTQTSTQDSVSAPLNSGMDGLALGYPPQRADGRQPDSAERRSGTPAQGSSPAPNAGMTASDGATDAEKPAGDA